MMPDDASIPVRSYAKRNQHLAQGFQNWLTATHKADTTRQSYGETVDFFLEFMGSEDIATATHRTLSLFMGTLHARGLTAVSLNRHVHGLRSFYKWIGDCGIIRKNPARLIPNRKLPSYIPRTTTNAEIEKLLEAAKQPPKKRAIELRDKALIELGYGSGLRVSELSQVRTADLDFGDGTIGRVLVRKGKGDKQRYVPFGSKAIAALREYLAERKRPSEWLFDAATRYQEDVWLIGNVWRGVFAVKGKFTQVTLGYMPEHRFHLYAELVIATKQDAETELRRIINNTPGANVLGTRPISARTIQFILRGLAKRAGIKHVNPHSLRHGFATALHNGGVGLREVQEMLGHTSVSTTARYLRTSFHDLKEAHSKFHPHAGGDNV